MRQNSFGKLWPVSALTLGGGGIGMVWGETTFDECVATVHEAVAAGINLIDLAPSYGDGRAERVVGEVRLLLVERPGRFSGAVNTSLTTRATIRSSPRRSSRARTRPE